jgi:hypothetical protein
MASIDHGRWSGYTPGTLPPEAPPGALYIRRDSDGVDWYVYLRDVTSFGADTVKLSALWQDAYNGYVVSVATYDADRLFPVDQIVREITDYTGSDPQADYGSRLYDPATDSFSDLPPLPPPADIKALLDRVAQLEAKQRGV